MLPQFPEKIDPWRAARSQQEIVGAVQAQEFTRIPPPGGILGPAQVHIGFSDRVSVASDKRVKIDLELQATMTWLCQRCLEPVQWLHTVSSEIEIIEPRPMDESGNYTSGADSALDNEHEVIEVALGDHLRLIELIEDELLLALPFSPTHDNCEQVALEEEVVPVTKKNPFAELAQLQVGKSKNTQE